MSRRAHGFTLVEVMVAVAILALALAAIFSSEAGAVKLAARARKTGLASLLVRCKMGEIEEEVANKGLPALFAQGTDTCCKDGPIDGFSCDWEIEPVLLPDNMFAPQNEEQKSGLPGTSSNSTTPGSLGSGALSSGSGSPISAALSALALGGTQTPPNGQNPANPQNPSSQTGQNPQSSTQNGQSSNPMDMLKNINPADILAGGGVGGLAAMALQFVYPVLKPSFESQIRRATVTVHWKEGSVAHKFDVTQYLVADQGVAPGIDPNTGQPIQGAGLTGSGLPASTGLPGLPSAPGLGR